MTKDQLNEIGIPKNQWSKFDMSFRSIQLSNDAHLYLKSKSTEFYFDDTNELLFVRHNMPTIGYITIPNNGTEDRTVGNYQEVFTYDSIVSIQ